MNPDAGGYVLDECIHSGPNSNLYRVHLVEGARDADQPLVMKLAHARDGQPGGGFIHSEIEHQVLPRLAGPHAPRFVASLDLAAAPRLVMAWVPGRTVQAWLDEAGRPGNEEVLRFGVALARAVHQVHGQQVVHHDLQPAHVMVTPDGEVVLLGWGRAWHAQLPDLLAGGRVAPDAWVSPEQVLGRRGDARSDVFAIGAILYRLLAGVPPHGEPHGRVGLRRRLWRNPVPLRRLNPTVTPWLEAVVQRCLEPEAARRYPSAAHLAFDLLHPQPLPSPTSGLMRWCRHAPLQARRVLRALGWPEAPGPVAAPGACQVPLVLLAIASGALSGPVPEPLRLAARRALGVHPFARLLCLSVLQPGAAVPDSSSDSPDGTSTNSPPDPPPAAGNDATQSPRRWLARLRSWARPLGQPGREAVCRVVEHEDAAREIVGVARDHEISEIILRADDPVAMGVARDAPCTVQLVR